MTDTDRYTSLRLSPSQTRGKERIRLILDTALHLFHDTGIDRTTTNDIAKAAGIPIGSIYRYFHNKEEIILAITDLQVADVTTLFTDIAKRPDLAKLSWPETITLITDTWTRYARQNNSFAFLYFLRCSRTLSPQASARWHHVHNAYKAILQQRNPRIPDAEIGVYVQLTWSAVELAMGSTPKLSHQAAAIVAHHLEQQYPVV